MRDRLDLPSEVLRCCQRISQRTRFARDDERIGTRLGARLGDALERLPLHEGHVLGVGTQRGADLIDGADLRERRRTLVLRRPECLVGLHVGERDVLEIERNTVGDEGLRDHRGDLVVDRLIVGVHGLVIIVAREDGTHLAAHIHASKTIVDVLDRDVADEGIALAITRRDEGEDVVALLIRVGIATRNHRPDVDIDGKWRTLASQHAVVLLVFVAHGVGSHELLLDQRRSCLEQHQRVVGAVGIRLTEVNLTRFADVILPASGREYATHESCWDLLDVAACATEQRNNNAKHERLDVSLHSVLLFSERWGWRRWLDLRSDRSVG